MILLLRFIEEPRVQAKQVKNQTFHFLILARNTGYLKLTQEPKEHLLHWQRHLS